MAVVQMDYDAANGNNNSAMQPHQSSSSRPHKRPRHRATPRLGQTPSALSGLTRALQENRSIPVPSGMMSHTAARRLNVDKALESLGSQQNDSALLMLITMMDKRESERLARQEESDRKMREEAILREERREDQRREDQRMNQMFMVMMAKMMGDRKTRKQMQACPTTHHPVRTEYNLARRRCEFVRSQCF